MNFPSELKYSKSHEWVRMEGDVAVIGITDYAQDALGDLVFVGLPEVGDTVSAEEPFGDVESVKAVSDINSPVSGTVCEITDHNRPQLIFKVIDSIMEKEGAPRFYTEK